MSLFCWSTSPFGSIFSSGFLMANKRSEYLVILWKGLAMRSTRDNLLHCVWPSAHCSMMMMMTTTTTILIFYDDDDDDDRHDDDDDDDVDDAVLLLLIVMIMMMMMISIQFFMKRRNININNCDCYFRWWKASLFLLFVHLSIFLPVSQSFRLMEHPLIHPSIHSFILSPINSSTHPSIHSSIHLLINLSIHS